ncbi:hypothetical protein TNIN_249341 [Trichonephila inaurata madagascariensis]|uniref:Uncharacterized protein n=1 Tax=Trichonephila inaurata madagascariensis TaxID=2747483 RepID=A0A8X6XIP6_9ARAC|nr:hypothetical protein TNIN_249341 [Trichonephila inaurata madagascariensis]
MRGLKDGAVARKPRPTFPDVRGQVEDIILGNRERRKTSLWSSSHSPKQERLLIYATSAINSQRTLSDRASPFLCPVKD